MIKQIMGKVAERESYPIGILQQMDKAN